MLAEEVFHIALVIFVIFVIVSIDIFLERLRRCQGGGVLNNISTSLLRVVDIVSVRVFLGTIRDLLTFLYL